MKKTQHFKTVQISSNYYEAVRKSEPNTKVRIHDRFGFGDMITEFWIPTLSVDQHTQMMSVSNLATKRAKHEGITWEHASFLTGLQK